MKSLVRKFASWLESAWKQINSLIDSIESVEWVVVCNKNGQPSDCNFKITKDNFRYYIWSSNIESKWLYDEQFILWSIWSLLKMLPEWEKLVIEIASDVSLIMNDLWVEDGKMTSESQCDYIRSLVSRYYPKYTDRVIIENTWDKHWELLTSLNDDWKKAIDWDVQLDKENINPWDIAKALFKWLYDESWNDTQLFRDFKWTRNGKQKRNKSEKAIYYALIEISCRLSDFLNWIEIQSNKKAIGFSFG